MSTIPFLRFEPFDVRGTHAVSEAFDRACSAIHTQGQLDAAKKAMLAEQIIEAAKKGERDPQRLCAQALDALRQLNESEVSR